MAHKSTKNIFLFSENVASKIHPASKIHTVIKYLYFR